MTRPVADVLAIATVLRQHGWSGKPGALCWCGWSETSHIQGIHEDHRRHVAREIIAVLADATTDRATPDDWPCADYKAPLTCLTTPKRKTLLCDWCRSQPDRDSVQALYPAAAPVDATLTDDLDVFRRLDAAYRVAYDAALHGEPNLMPDIAHQVMVGLPRLIELAARVSVDRAKVEAAHREEWASYIENWSAAVGPEPPTVEGLIRALRSPHPPFGVARAVLGAPTTEAEASDG